MSSGNTFLKMIGSFFLSVLIIMLMVSFLPGESENAFFSSIFNLGSRNAGMIGDRVISTNFFKLTRKSCIYRYEQYGASVSNSEIINDCAYDTAQSLMIADRISQKLGFDISSRSVREDLSNQASLSHENSLKQAGYSSEDVLSAEEIYKRMITQLPLDYRIKEKKVSAFYNDFLVSPLEDTKSQLKIKEDMETLTFDLDLLYISNKVLNDLADTRIDTSKETLMKMYEEELKSKKEDDTKSPTFDEREEFLKRKKLLQERNTKVDELKTEIKQMISTADFYTLKNTFLGSKQLNVNESLTSFWNLSIDETKNINLGKNNNFIKDIINFEGDKLKGPYNLENGLVLVYYKKITRLSEQAPKKEDDKSAAMSENTNSFVVVGSIYQYFTKKFPIYRQESSANSQDLY